MDIKELQTFIALAEHKNYLNTSLQLNYAPSTLSKHIQLLEQELGIKLLRRQGRSISLTEDGKRFLTYARQMVAIYYDSMDAFSETASLREMIRIGGCETGVVASLLPMFTHFSQQHPDVHFDMRTSPNAFVPEWLEQKNIDMGFYFTMELMQLSGYHTVPLYREPWCLLTSPENPIARRGALRFCDLNGQRFAYCHQNCCVAQEFVRRIEKSGARPQAVSYLSSLDVTFDYARNNNALIIMTRGGANRCAKNEGLTVLRMEDEPVVSWLEVVYRSDMTLTPGERALIRESRRFARRMAAEYPEVTLAEEEEEMAGGAIAARA